MSEGAILSIDEGSMSSNLNGLLLVQGELDSVPLTLLIDSGATHNFIALSLVQQHASRWPTSPSPLSAVRMGDGKSIPAARQQVTPRLLKLFGGRGDPQVSGTGDVSPPLQVVCFNRVPFHAISQLTPYCDAVLGLDFFRQAKLNFVYKEVGTPSPANTAPTSQLTPRVIEGVSVAQGEAMIDLPLWRFDKQQWVTLSEGAALAVLHWSQERVKLLQAGKHSELEKEAVKVTDLLMKEFKQVFADPTEGTPPPVRDVEMSEHKIQLDPSVPTPKPRPFIRLSAEKEEVLHKQIDEMVKQGWIRPSQSSFASATFLVPKADGGWRMVVDYRALNNATIKDSYPLPHADDLFHKMRKATVFSKIDLKSGFYQIPLAKEDWYKTAFRTSRGLFEYTVVPMGLCNAPATFMRLMNNIFKDMIAEGFVTVFMDDIVIYSESVQDHWVHLRKVLVRLKEQKLFAKASKCSFFSRAVQFLGHTLTPNGIEPMVEKLQAIEAWPTPTNREELRSFLGLCNYYNKFIANYSTIAAPLTSLTGDTVTWHWSQLHTKSFQQLKLALNSSPCLVHPNPELQFVLATDASDFALGAVLMQDHGKGLQPIQFYNRKLNAAERNYSVYDKEMLAVVSAMNNWYYHLESSKFPVLVMTDHQPLAYSSSAPVKPNLRAQSRWVRWLSELGAFKIQWQYVKGEKQMADPLSRRPDLKALEQGELASEQGQATALHPLKSEVLGMHLCAAMSAIHAQHPGWREGDRLKASYSQQGSVTTTSGCPTCQELKHELRLMLRNYGGNSKPSQLASVVNTVQGQLHSLRANLLRDEGREDRQRLTLQRYQHNHEGPVPGAPRPDSHGNVVMPTRRCAARVLARVPAARSGRGRSQQQRGQQPHPQVYQQCKQLTRFGAYCWSHLAREERLRIKASQIPGAGRGLFATAPIRRGERVCWYTGDVMRFDHEANAQKGGVYYLQLSRYVGIDAARTDTAPGRFLNDPSGSGRRPNCKFAVDRVHNLACIRATCNIQAGQELLVSYGRGYWKAMKRLDPQVAVILALEEPPDLTAGSPHHWLSMAEHRQQELVSEEAVLFLVLHDASQSQEQVVLAGSPTVRAQPLLLHNHKVRLSPSSHLATSLALESERDAPPSPVSSEEPARSSSPAVRLSPDESGTAQPQWLPLVSPEKLSEMVRRAAAGDHQYQVLLQAVETLQGTEVQVVGEGNPRLQEEVHLMVKRLSKPSSRRYQVVNGLLMVRNRSEWLLVVPKDPDNALRTMVLAYLHDADGHHGRDKVAAAASTKFWWQGMDAAVRKYVASCPRCQQVKPPPGKEQGFAMPLPVPEGPWTWVTMDFLGPLPRTQQGYDMVLVFVDRFTKMKHFAPCKSTITAPQAVELFEQHVVRLHGWPNVLTSDRGAIFVSKFWESYFARFGVQLRRATAYHPQTDGQSERDIKTLQKVLESYVAATRDDWDRHLPMAEFSINSMPSATTGKSPFFVLYGHEATKPIDLALAKLGVPTATATAQQQQPPGDSDMLASNPLVDQRVEHLRQVVTLTRQRLLATQQEQAAAIAGRRRPASYLKDQQVMLSTEHLVLPTDKALSSAKLRPKFVGPYTIVRVINPNAVELKLNAGDTFHPVVNVARLKPYVPLPVEFVTRPQPPLRPPPTVSDDNGQEEWRVETIVGDRYNRRRKRWEYCVKWLGYDDSECTWEPVEHLFDNQQFLEYIELRPTAEVVQHRVQELQVQQREREAASSVDSEQPGVDQLSHADN